jgi:hypothetical protein
MLVHLLVLNAFTGPPPTPKHECNHSDGCKTNNRADNLEWMPRSQNIAHAYATGLHKRYVGSGASAAKLTEAQVEFILALVVARVYRRDIAKQFGISQRMISDIVSGEHWKHVARPHGLNNRRTGRQILTEDAVREIKSLLLAGDLTHGAIAARYGVSGPTIWQIADGRTWKNVK